MSDPQEAPAPVIRTSAPIVPVRDVTASVAFYTRLLGFATEFVAADGTTAEVRRGGARIMLIACEDEEVLGVTATNMSVYIRVDGVDALWAELAEGLGELPARQVRPPFDQAYGMREFHVKDPDGFLMFFGEAIG